MSEIVCPQCGQSRLLRRSAPPLGPFWVCGGCEAIHGFVSTRTFRMWDYGVGHGQLVLRSPGEDEGGPHLDLHFHGVEYLRVPTRLESVELVEATADETEEVRQALPEARRVGRRTFVLSSTTGRFLVVAAGLEITEEAGPRMGTAIVHAEG